MDINKLKNKLLKFHIISEIQCPIFFDEKLFFIIIKVQQHLCKMYPNELNDLQLFLIKQKGLRYTLNLE